MAGDDKFDFGEDDENGNDKFDSFKTYNVVGVVYRLCITWYEAGLKLSVHNSVTGRRFFLKRK